MSEEIHVSVISRNHILREGLRRVLSDLSFNVQEVVTNATTLQQAYAGTSRRIILIDSDISEDPIQLCHQLKMEHPVARIVLMSDDYSIENVGRAFSAGVDGYVVKTIPCESLAAALRLVALGEKVFPSQVAGSLLKPGWRTSGQGSSGRIEDVSLSIREADILRCLVNGEANKVISRRLSITEATVKVHVKAILRKLRVSNRTQAAIWALARGFVEQAPERAEAGQALPEEESLPALAA